MSEEFKIQEIDFKDSKVLEAIPSTLILHDTYMEYKWKVKMEKVIDGVPKEMKYNGFQNTLKRSIGTIQAAWSNQRECYEVNIEVATNESGITFLFNTMKEAIELKDKIWQWVMK